MFTSVVRTSAAPTPPVLAPNHPLPELDRWTVLRPLGEGAQSHTYLVAPRGDPDAAPAVAKVMRLRGTEGHILDVKQQRWRLRREVAALRRLERAGCEGTTRVLDHGVRTRRTEQPWMVMPHHAGGPLRWFDGVTFRYREPLRGRVGRTLEVAEALADTLAAMHARPVGVVHRDVHLGNVLLDQVGGPPVLADFGSAAVPGAPAPLAGEHPVFSGAWLWRPPELDSGAGDPAAPPADVFMLGGVIFEALSGRLLPWAGHWEGRTVHEDPEHTLARETDDRRLGAVNELLRGMFALDPAKRPTAAQVAERCLHIRRARERPPVPTPVAA